jgi:hypothetical protein
VGVAGATSENSPSRNCLKIPDKPLLGSHEWSKHGRDRWFETRIAHFEKQLFAGLSKYGRLVV